MSASERVLVTGGTGFLGRWIVRQLRERGQEVVVLARSPAPELAAAGVTVRPGDLLDRETVVAACRGCDVVIHTAARAGIWGTWNDYYTANVQGTEHVLAGCRAHGVRKLVYTSSPSVTFEGVDQNGIDESAPYARRFQCAYPQSKALAEQRVLAAHGQQGLATCALRPHLIWGPGDRHLIPRLIERARRGQLRRVGDGRNLIDTIYVENAAAAHLQAADALTPSPGPGGRAYFLSQGEPVNCWDWIDEVLQSAGLPPVQRAIPYRVAYCAGAVLEGLWRLLRIKQEPRMTRFLAAQLARSHYFDLSAARRDFGYAPEISQAEGMRRLQAWLAAGSP